MGGEQLCEMEALNRLDEGVEVRRVQVDFVDSRRLHRQLELVLPPNPTGRPSMSRKVEILVQICFTRSLEASVSIERIYKNSILNLHPFQIMLECSRNSTLVKKANRLISGGDTLE